MSQELLQIRVNEASKCSKMKLSNFQSVVSENCSKLEINSLPNLKASMKTYVLTQYVSAKVIQVPNDCTSIVKQTLQYFPDETLSELASVTSGHKFYTKNTFSQINVLVSRLKW